MADIMTPALGESVTEATVARWAKKAGDAVRKDEILVELETDKVSLEVASPSDGTLSEIAFEEGATVEPGAVLGKITEGAAAPKAAAPAAAPAPAKAPEPAPEPPKAAAPAPAAKAAAEPVLAPSAQRVRWRRTNWTQDRSPAPARTGGSPRAMRWPRWTPAPGPARGASAHGRPRSARTRGAGADDAPAPDHRAPTEGSPEQRRHADHLQRGGHERGDGDARPVQGRLREAPRGIKLGFRAFSSAR